MKVKLGDVATYINGYAFKPSDWKTQGIPIIRIQDLTGNSYQTNYYDGESIDKKYEVNEGDVLISWSASLGIYIWKGEKALLNQHIFKVVFDKIDIDKMYYIYALKFSLMKMKSFMHGATMKHIVKKDFDNITIPFPSLEEQSKIAGILQLVEGIIEKRKKQLEDLDELVKARFVEMFGDPVENNYNFQVHQLSKYLNVIGGYAFKSENFLDNGIPILRIGNINSGYFKPVNMVYWCNDPTLEKYKVYPNDLVISLTGTVGKDDYGNVCILGNDFSEYYLNQRNAKLEIIEALNSEYLMQILKFKYIKSKLTGISRGVRQANISNRDILNLKIPIPPIELQNQFADFVKQTEEMKKKVQKSLDEMQVLFDKLMQDYF
ncbi:restriction endonuclease subunit S [Anaerofustis butyriciformans]|uniref:restriction endonuclease subunit S n=1 Tax=Anaerofustis butyriciformans TaxID=3108533 RepID=UPI003F8C8A50